MATYKLVIVGDSISDTGGIWGSAPPLYMTVQSRVPGGTLADYWVNKLQAWLTSHYPQHTFNLVNLALSGSSCYDFGPNGDDLRLIAPNGGLNADFGVFLLGVNDDELGGSNNSGNYTVEQQAADLEWIIPRLPAHGVVCSLFPTSASAYWSPLYYPNGQEPVAYQLANIKPFGDDIVARILAEKPGWKFADIWTPMLAIGPPTNYYNTVDGLHPGILGHAAIFDIVQPQVAAMLYSPVYDLAASIDAIYDAPSLTDSGTGADGGAVPILVTGVPSGTDSGVGSDTGTLPPLVVHYDLAAAIEAVYDVPDLIDAGLALDNGDVPTFVVGKTAPNGTDAGVGSDTGGLGIREVYHAHLHGGIGITTPPDGAIGIRVLPKGSATWQS